MYETSSASRISSWVRSDRPVVCGCRKWHKEFIRKNPAGGNVYTDTITVKTLLGHNVMVPTEVRVLFLAETAEVHLVESVNHGFKPKNRDITCNFSLMSLYAFLRPRFNIITTVTPHASPALHACYSFFTTCFRLKYLFPGSQNIYESSPASTVALICTSTIAGVYSTG